MMKYFISCPVPRPFIPQAIEALEKQDWEFVQALFYGHTKMPKTALSISSEEVVEPGFAILCRKEILSTIYTIDENQGLEPPNLSIG